MGEEVHGSRGRWDKFSLAKTSHVLWGYGHRTHRVGSAFLSDIAILIQLGQLVGFRQHLSESRYNKSAHWIILEPFHRHSATRMQGAPGGAPEASGCGGLAPRPRVHQSQSNTVMRSGPRVPPLHSKSRPLTQQPPMVMDAY